MHRKYLLTNAFLWAVAIVASAAVGAPTFLSLILLPCLGTVALLVNWHGARVA
jgi:hypothetical protein